jgi:hypothetical protein
VITRSLVKNNEYFAADYSPNLLGGRVSRENDDAYVGKKRKGSVNTSFSFHFVFFVIRICSFGEFPRAV